MAKTITIDPKDFSKGEWTELYYAQIVFTDMKEERHHLAKPFKATARQVERAIQTLTRKVESIERGHFGTEDFPSQNETCIDKLDGAAAMLRSYMGVRDPEFDRGVAK